MPFLIILSVLAVRTVGGAGAGLAVTAKAIKCEDEEMYCAVAGDPDIDCVHQEWLQLQQQDALSVSVSLELLQRQMGKVYTSPKMTDYTNLSVALGPVTQRHNATGIFQVPEIARPLRLQHTAGLVNKHHNATGISNIPELFQPAAMQNTTGLNDILESIRQIAFATTSVAFGTFAAAVNSTLLILEETVDKLALYCTNFRKSILHKVGEKPDHALTRFNSYWTANIDPLDQLLVPVATALNVTLLVLNSALNSTGQIGFITPLTVTWDNVSEGLALYTSVLGNSTALIAEITTGTSDDRDLLLKDLTATLDTGLFTTASLTHSLVEGLQNAINVTFQQLSSNTKRWSTHVQSLPSELDTERTILLQHASRIAYKNEAALNDVIRGISLAVKMAVEKSAYIGRSRSCTIGFRRHPSLHLFFSPLLALAAVPAVLGL